MQDDQRRATKKNDLLDRKFRALIWTTAIWLVLRVFFCAMSKSWSGWPFYTDLGLLLITNLYFFVLAKDLQTWTNTRWIAISVLLILWVFINVSLTQAQLVANITPLYKARSYPLLDGEYYLSLRYPDKLLVGAQIPVEAAIWIARTDLQSINKSQPSNTFSLEPPENVTIGIGSLEDSILFSKMPEANGASVWVNMISISVPTNGQAVKLFILPNEILDGRAQVATFVFNDFSYLARPLIEIIGEREQLQNAWFMILLSGFGLVFTVISSVTAGLQQLDERRRTQRMEVQKDGLKRLRDYQPESSLLSVIMHCLDSLHDGVDDEDLRNQYRVAYSTFLDTHFKETRFPDFEKDPELISRANELWAHFDNAPNSKLQEMDVLLRRVNSAPIKYSQEKFPLEKRFLKESVGPIFPNNSPFPFMAFNPFYDFRNPFAYTEERGHLFLPLTFNFPVDRLQNQIYRYGSSWDLQAGLYDYCRTFPTQTLRSTYFVPVFPNHLATSEASFDRSGIEISEYVLAGMAREWGRILSGYPNLEQVMNRPRQEIDLLIRLLLHNFESVEAVIDFLTYIAYLEETTPVRFPLDDAFYESLDRYRELDVQLSQFGRYAAMLLMPSQLARNEGHSGHTQIIFINTNFGNVSNSKGDTFPESLYKQIQSTESTYRSSWVLFTIASETDLERKLSNDDLADMVNRRVALASHEVVSSLDQLFDFPNPAGPAELLLAQKASGSPGRVVALGNQLFQSHLNNQPTENTFKWQELETLE